MAKRSFGATTLAYPQPVFLVGTYDRNGRPNIMTSSWGGVCALDPPCLAVSIRESRWTYHAVVMRKAFTVNIPSTALVAETDYAGMVFGHKTNKFEHTGLTPVRGTYVDAPYVEECPIVIELELFKTMALGSHTQFIGRVMDVKVDENCFEPETDKLDVLKVDPMVYDACSEAYYSFGKIIGSAFSVGKKIA